MKEIEKIAVQDIIDTTDRTRVKVSKIGAAILKHVEKFDDIFLPSSALQDKNLPQRGDL